MIIPWHFVQHSWFYCLHFFPFLTMHPLPSSSFHVIPIYPQKRNEGVKHSLMWKGHESRLILTNVISSRESVQFYAKTKPVSSLYIKNMVYRFKYFLIQDSNTQLLTMNKLHTSLAVQCLTTKHSTWHTTFLALLGIFEWRNVKWFVFT